MLNVSSIKYQIACPMEVRKTQCNKADFLKISRDKNTTGLEMKFATLFISNMTTIEGKKLFSRIYSWNLL
jgi:hypothetical protein